MNDEKKGIVSVKNSKTNTNNYSFDDSVEEVMDFSDTFNYFPDEYLGGNQNYLSANKKELLSNAQTSAAMKAMVGNNFNNSNITDEELGEYFDKVQIYGGKYVAQVNTLFNNYKDNMDELIDKLDIDKSNVTKSDGSVDYELLSNYVLLDYTSSVASKNGANSIGDVSSLNLQPEMSNANQISNTAGNFQSYLNQRGINIDVNNVTSDVQRVISNNVGDSSKMREGICQYIDGQINSGKNVVVDSNVSFTLLKESNGKRSMVIPSGDGTTMPMPNFYGNNRAFGGHSMTVTGTSSDGFLEVSSWGDTYYLDPLNYATSNNGGVYHTYEYR